jgi:hypothetical protein
MAAAKGDNKQTAAEVDPFAGYMPEGFDAKENKKVGGLTPIWGPKPAWEQKWPPCVGFMVCVETIDHGEEIKDPKQRYREYIRMEAQVPTKGVLGPKNEQDVIDIKVGDDILMPMSGNIKNIKTIRGLIADRDNVYLAMFQVTGQQDTGQPTPMWKIDARINSKKTPRAGRFALPPSANFVPQLSGQPGGGVTSDGRVYDRDGVVQDSVVG